MSKTRRAGKGLFAIAFLAVCLSAYLAIQYFYFGANLSAFVQDKLRSISLSDFWYAVLYVHIASGIAAICIGWVQFVPKLRAKSVRLHQAVGRVYAGAVILSGLSGVYLSFYATGGWVSSAGFLLLSLAWLYTLGRGVRAIVVGRDRASHRRWMTLNYALTLAAVTLRIYLPLSIVLFGFEAFNDYYRVIAWLCWVPNLIFAQWWLSRRSNRPPSLTA